MWKAKIASPLPSINDAHLCLSPDELSRAGRFRFNRDKNRFIMSRILLRRIASRYLAVGPADLRFSYNPYGKSFIMNRPCKGSLQFNLSRSGNLALFAIASAEREVGIDIERVRMIADLDHIVATFFSPRESSIFQSLLEHQKNKAFFTCWTRKEAFVKAIGKGFSFPMDQFEVSFAPGQPARLLDIMGNPKEKERWMIADFNPGPGYAAAVCADGTDFRLRCWSVQDFPALQGND